ncbi:MAG: hypothetical protein RDA78_24910 [Roseibium sp.]|uniref:hypothetical protein n=1 Tax=Roseibium sp. TaxID=1936156 RepID=UPI003D9C043D
MLTVAASPSSSASPLLVTSGADSGEGSFRAALEAASNDWQPRSIFVVTRDEIDIDTSLVYSGRAPLEIYGNGQTVHARENVTLLAISESADLTVSKLHFKGPGGFSIENRGDREGSGGKGIFVDVRDDQTGVVRLVLEKVTVSGVAYHGIHVSDCDLADDCGGGSGGGGDGAPASIEARFTNVSIERVGLGAFDADGIRIDERGDGDIAFASFNSVFRKVGADGVELDEVDAGSVCARTIENRFLDNGDYCDPKILHTFLPDEPDGAFDDGEMNEAGLPANVTGSPDDRCFEREVSLYGSGSVEEYEFSIDLDDGIDIDEAGDGDLVMTMTDSEITGNLDEGVDLDEEDAGNAVISHVRSFADHNTDDGFRTSESGPGDLTAFVYEVGAWKNGGNGLRFDEADQGTVTVNVYRATTEGNDDGDDTGIRVSREGDGEGKLIVHESDFRDGIDARNVEVVDAR